MKLLSQNTLQMLRGMLVAAAMALLTMTVFALFAHEGPWRTVAYLVRKLESPLPSASQATAPRPSSVAASGQAAHAPPAASSGGGAGSGSGSVTGIAAGSAPSAGAALRQVLSEYRDNPNATTTVTLSSGGRISTGHEGALTVQDGVPSGAFQDSTQSRGGNR